MLKLHYIGFKCYLIHVLMKTVYTEFHFPSRIFIHQSHNFLKIILTQCRIKMQPFSAH